MLSVTQYAKQRNITRQAVLKQLKAGRSLPGISNSKKVGTTWVLTPEKKVKKTIHTDS